MRGQNRLCRHRVHPEIVTRADGELDDELLALGGLYKKLFEDQNEMLLARERVPAGTNGTAGTGDGAAVGAH